MNPLAVFPVENTVYNELLLIYWQKILAEHKKIIAKEGVGNEPDHTKLEQYYSAINYVFVLYLLSKESNDLDFWKEKMNYEKIRDCFLGVNIDLDALLQTAEDAGS